jgi:F420-dependent oxidoreductase-like protein
MRVSISISDYSWDDVRGRLGDLAKAADEAGVDTIWLPDHAIQADPRMSPDAEMLETYTTLGYIAALTSNVRLGAMVTPVSYRFPAALVKAVTTLDVLSGGRAWFGIGAGYSENEARWMGLPFPAVSTRFEQLDEALRIALQMWSGDESAFEGKHFSLERPINSPRSVQQPHPPILIGGTGEKKTLRLVAQYADSCNLSDMPDEGATIRRKLAVLAQHCEAVGRPFDAIEKTVSTRFIDGESAADFAGRAEVLRGYGCDHLVLFFSWSVEALEALGKLIPAITDV